MSDVGLIAQAIAEIAKVVGNWQVSSERKRLNYRLEAAENYVFVNEKSGQYNGISDKKKDQLLYHFRKRIFDSN